MFRCASSPLQRLPGQCLSRKAGIVRCCLWFGAAPARRTESAHRTGRQQRYKTWDDAQAPPHVILYCREIRSEIAHLDVELIHVLLFFHHQFSWLKSKCTLRQSSVLRVRRSRVSTRFCSSWYRTGSWRLRAWRGRCGRCGGCNAHVFFGHIIVDDGVHIRNIDAAGVTSWQPTH